MEVASPTLTLPRGQPVARSTTGATQIPPLTLPPSVVLGSGTASRWSRLRPAGFSTARSLLAAQRHGTPQPHRPDTNEVQVFSTSAAPVPVCRWAGSVFSCVGQKGELHPWCYCGSRRTKGDLKASELWAGCYGFFRGAQGSPPSPWAGCVSRKVEKFVKWSLLLGWGLWLWFCLDMPPEKN